MTAKGKQAARSDICFPCGHNEQTSEGVGRRARQREFASEETKKGKQAARSDICFPCGHNEQTSEGVGRRARKSKTTD